MSLFRNLLVIAPLAVVSLTFASSMTTPSTLQEDTPLQQAMGVLKKGQRSLKKLIGEPEANQSALLDLLKSMEAANLVALAEVVPEPEGLSGKDQALFPVGYKLRMTELLTSVFELQTAALNQDAAALKASYDTLKNTKKAGHQDFRDFD